jgi:NADPH:quinone reductase-like Zn-dependent oxidoreductase
MVMGVDIDPRVYMGKSSRSRNCRIKSYEKRYSLPATFPRSDNQAAMAEILDLLMANKVRLIVDQVLPLSEAAEAHARLSNRGAMGKIILVP